MRVHQLNVHAHQGSGFADSSLKDVARSQLCACGASIVGLSFQPHRGVHYGQIRELRQGRGNILNEALGKTFYLRICGRMLKGKYCNPHFSGRGTGRRPCGGSGGCIQIAQFVVYIARSLIAVSRIFHQATPDDPLQMFRSVRLQSTDRCRCISHDGGNQLSRGVSVKGAASGKHFVKNDSKRENIRPVIQSFSLNLLRRHVRHCPQNNSGFRLRACFHA